MWDFPPIDDHLVEPETGRYEIVRGEWMEAVGAHPPHAERQTRLGYVIEPNVAPGYVAEELATIDACTDPDRIQRWLLAAVRTHSVAELLALE